MDTSDTSLILHFYLGTGPDLMGCKMEEVLCVNGCLFVRILDFIQRPLVLLVSRRYNHQVKVGSIFT